MAPDLDPHQRSGYASITNQCPDPILIISDPDPLIKKSGISDPDPDPDPDSGSGSFCKLEIVKKRC